MTVACVTQERCSASSAQSDPSRNHSCQCHRPARTLAFLIGTPRGVTSRSIVFPLAISATRRSYVAWRRSQSNGSPPKYRASRRAVSAVTPRLMRRTSLIRGGVTPRAFASAVALRPAGSTKSLRRISPGCTGCPVVLLMAKHAPIDSVTPSPALEQRDHIPYNGMRYEYAPRHSDRIAHGKASLLRDGRQVASPVRSTDRALTCRNISDG